MQRSRMNANEDSKKAREDGNQFECHVNEIVLLVDDKGARISCWKYVVEITLSDIEQ